jgi:hypothetical protein
MFPVLIRKVPCPVPKVPVVAPDSAQKTAKRAFRTRYGMIGDGRGNVVAKLLIECPGVMLRVPNLRAILHCKISLDVDCAPHYILVRAGGWPVSQHCEN